MNYFLYDKSTGSITGSGYTPDGTIPPDCIECTPEQAANPQAWQVVNGKVVASSKATLAAQAQEKLKSDAISAIPETDMVALRCWKAGVAFPSDWVTYTTDLRNIVNGTDITSTSLPTKPAYPSGT